MELRASIVTLSLAERFGIARGSRTEQRVVSLEIEADGTIGRGEAAPIYYRGETAESALAFLERVQPPDDPFALEAALGGGADDSTRPGAARSTARSTTGSGASSACRSGACSGSRARPRP